MWAGECTRRRVVAAVGRFLFAPIFSGREARSNECHRLLQAPRARPAVRTGQTACADGDSRHHHHGACRRPLCRRPARAQQFFESSTQVADWGRKLESQRQQVLETKQELQNHLDALATRVGQMNAHVIRLDALGRRLTEMAHLDKGEFNFDTVPAVGGPEALVEGGVVDGAGYHLNARRPDPSDQGS